MISSEETLRLLIALFIGGIIGIEREASGKAAGLRTMILISVGSTLFTIISMKLGAHGTEDRIAANIVTGIGFIGAGVVFKDGFNVVGITSASTIWVTAALGMAVGAGDYKLAGEGAVLTIVVLFLFEYLQSFIVSRHQRRGYTILFQKGINAESLEEKMAELLLKPVKRSETKDNGELRYVVDVFGTKKRIEAFNQYLLDLDTIKSFNEAL